MTKIRIALFLFILANLSILMLVSAEEMGGGVAVFPSRLYINIHEYPTEEIKHFIRVYNKYSYPINVSVKIYHPNPQNMVKGYSLIPDLSWVKIVPDKTQIPAKDSKKLFVYINIPDSEKSLYHNESWEVWAITSGEENPVYGGTAINTALVTRLLITTSPREAMVSQNLYLVLGIIMLILVATAVFYFKKKKMPKI